MWDLVLWVPKIVSELTRLLEGCIKAEYILQLPFSFYLHSLLFHSLPLRLVTLAFSLRTLNIVTYVFSPFLLSSLSPMGGVNQ